jgi:exosortase
VNSASITARTGVFATYCLAVMLVNLPMLRRLYHYSTTNETASHIILIPIIALALAYRSRAAILAEARYAWPAGVAAIAAGLVMFVAARLLDGPVTSGNALSLGTGALVLLWIGGFFLCFGPKAFRAALFPLLFLGLVIPIPDAVLDGGIWILRTGSTDAVGTLFSLTGTPYYREGFVFTLPSVVIEVAEECSGIRSSIALVITTLIAGHLCLDRPWKKLALVAVTVPLTILKNGIRIVTLSLLSIHVDPGFLTGQLHHDGGIVFFLMTLAMLAPILVWLRGKDTPVVAGNTPAAETA